MKTIKRYSAVAVMAAAMLAPVSSVAASSGHDEQAPGGVASALFTAGVNFYYMPAAGFLFGF